YCRIILDVPLVIRGEAADKKAFQAETFTLIVNAHGAQLMLEMKVTLGQKLVVINPENWNECEGKLAYVGPPYAGLARVGIEFTPPAPEFWSVSSPPPRLETVLAAFSPEVRPPLVTSFTCWCAVTGAQSRRCQEWHLRFADLMSSGFRLQ